MDVLQELQQRGGVFYLASPYSHPEKAMMASRAAEAKVASGKLMALGVKNFSPIAYCHDLAERFSLPTDAKWWWDFNLAFMEMSSGLIIVRLRGWKDSYGVKLELDWYKAKWRPVYLLTMFTEGNIDVSVF